MGVIIQLSAGRKEDTDSTRIQRCAGRMYALDTEIIHCKHDQWKCLGRIAA